MQHTTFTHAFARVLALVTLCLTVFVFTAKAGLDSYEIYLNNKLMLKQYVNQPLNLRKLLLEKVDVNDQLLIYYTHCSTKSAGTSRNIVIKDGQGNTLKRWEFANVAGSNTSMVIPVKELLLLEKNNAHHDLSFHYTAKELPEGMMLASFSLD